MDEVLVRQDRNLDPKKRILDKSYSKPILDQQMSLYIIVSFKNLRRMVQFLTKLLLI